MVLAPLAEAQWEEAREVHLEQAHDRRPGLGRGCASRSSAAVRTASSPH